MPSGLLQSPLSAAQQSKVAARGALAPGVPTESGQAKKVLQIPLCLCIPSVRHIDERQGVSRTYLRDSIARIFRPLEAPLVEHAGLVESPALVEEPPKSFINDIDPGGLQRSCEGPCFGKNGFFRLTLASRCESGESTWYPS